MASHASTPQSVLDAPTSTPTPACPRSKCREVEGHDDGAHGMQPAPSIAMVNDGKGGMTAVARNRALRRANGRTGLRTYKARVVPGIKRAPYDPNTPRRSKLLREIEREMRRRSSGA
jgi:hypothetical protein